MAPDGYEEVGESFGAHEDDLPLKPSFVGAFRIALISSKEITYRRRSTDHCLRLRGTGRDGP